MNYKNGKRIQDSGDVLFSPMSVAVKPLCNGSRLACRAVLAVLPVLTSCAVSAQNQQRNQSSRQASSGDMFARYKSGRDGAHTVEQRENAANKLNKILYSDDVPAVAKDGYYIGAKFNMDFLSWKNEYDYKGWASQPPTDSFDESLSGGSLSFGMYGKGAWRYEMEFAGGQGYSESADGVSFSLNKMSLAANIIKDFPSTGGSSLTPYIGVGAGVANLSVEMDMHTNDSQSEMYFDGGSEKQSKLGFDWRVLAGLGLKLSESWTADLGFRYEGLGSIEYSRPVILDPIVGSPETTEFTNKISPVAKTVYVGIRADL